MPTLKQRLAPVVALVIMGSAGIALTKSSEGKANRVYLDPVGIPTVCYGHTGPEVKLGMVFTDVQCENLLMSDYVLHNAALQGPNNCIKDAPLTQGQHDALLDFTFNVGVNKFCRSTLAHKVSIKDYPGASLEFNKWVNGKVNGKLVKLPGLIKRRTAETRMFVGESAPATALAPTRALRAISSDIQ